MFWGLVISRIFRTADQRPGDFHVVAEKQQGKGGGGDIITEGKNYPFSHIFYTSQKSGSQLLFKLWGPEANSFPSYFPASCYISSILNNIFANSM